VTRSCPIELQVRVPRDRIAFLTKTIEAMGHIAVVSTLDRKEGLLRILCDRLSEIHIRKALEGVIHMDIT